MMVKFDENQILKNGEYIYAQRAEIEKIADAVCEKGFDNILLLTYNILNKEPVSQSKAGHLVFELQLKNSASTFHG